jgi:hypothetical protein
MKPKTGNRKPETELTEALAWLDYCLDEVEAAGCEVKKIAGGASDPENYRGFPEGLANITTFRAGCARWRAGGRFALFPRPARRPGISGG